MQHWLRWLERGHPCNLAAKESGLECTWGNKDDFTVLVSGGRRCCWVSMCSVWPSHSKWLSEGNNESVSNFEHSSAETIPMIQKAIAMGNWWLAASSQQHICWCITSHAEYFGEISNHPVDSAPLQPTFGALWLLAFPKTKITFEREEISDHPWDSGKYNGAADGNWEDCVRSQGACFEGDQGIIVLCTTLLSSCIFFNKSLYFPHYMAGYLLDRLHILSRNKCFKKQTITN